MVMAGLREPLPLDNLAFPSFCIIRGKTEDVVLSILSRAKTSGFSALVFTVDTMLIGWRPFDLDTAFCPYFHGVGAQIGLTDPVFVSNIGMEPFPEDDKPAFPYIAARKTSSFETVTKPQQIVPRRAGVCGRSVGSHQSLAGSLLF